MITRIDLAKALHLSCVENYFLAWLNRYYAVEKLYGQSFVSIGQIFDEFAHGATYENYCTIPRLQDVAEEYGIAVHEYKRLKTDEAIEYMKSQREKTLCLARVNTNFFDYYRRSSWREDHYICIDGTLTWLNQYPLSDGVFTYTAFDRVYDGALSVYRLKDLSVTPPDKMSEEISRQDLKEIKLPERLQSIESAIGILRVTRRRMAAYYCDNAEATAILTKEIQTLDEMYFMIRMKQIKESGGADKNELRTGVKENLKVPLEKVLEAERHMQEVMRNGL